MDLTKLDFQQARIKQVLFKSRLRSVLYGVREPEPGLFTMGDNPLAQWLEAVVKPGYGNQPEVHEIERLLQQMLRTGRQLVAQYQQGHIEEARAGLDQINAQTDQIEALFQQLERRARLT